MAMALEPRFAFSAQEPFESPNKMTDEGWDGRNRMHLARHSKENPRPWAEGSMPPFAPPPAPALGAARTDRGLGQAVARIVDCALLANAGGSVERALLHIMEEARTLVGAEAAVVFVFDHEDGRLRRAGALASRRIAAASSGIAGQVAATGEPCLVADARAHHCFDTAVDGLPGLTTRSLLCVPVKAGRTSDAVGVVQLLNKAGPVAGADRPGVGACCNYTAAEKCGACCFDLADLQFLQALAARAARAFAGEVVRPSRVAAAVPRLSLALGDLAPPPKTASASVLDEASTVASPSDSPISSPVQTPLASLGGSPQMSPQAFPEEFRDEWSEFVCEVNGRDPAAISSPWTENGAIESCQTAPSALEQDEMLKMAIEGWRLDAFVLSESCAGKPLAALGTFSLEYLGLVEYFSIDRRKASAYFARIEEGYDEALPYHNRRHAASVVHSLVGLLRNTALAKHVAPALGCSEQLVALACVLAAAVHDFEHLGLTNDFLIRCSHERAREQGGQHVNEKHHVSAALSLLERPELDFTHSMPHADIHRLRSLMFELVLGTDMADHHAILGSLQAALADVQNTRDPPERFGAPPCAFWPRDAAEAVAMLQVAIKSSDLGHTALAWSSHVLWVELIEEELFTQGDRERDLGWSISPFMDRHSAGISRDQIPFFGKVVLPLFQLLARALPESQPLLDGARENFQRWERIRALDAGPPGGDSGRRHGRQPRLLDMWTCGSRIEDAVGQDATGQLAQATSAPPVFLHRPRSKSEPSAEHHMERTQQAAVRADCHAPRWGLKRFTRVVPSAGNVVA